MLENSLRLVASELIVASAVVFAGFGIGCGFGVGWGFGGKVSMGSRYFCSFCVLLWSCSVPWIAAFGDEFQFRDVSLMLLFCQVHH